MAAPQLNDSFEVDEVVALKRRLTPPKTGRLVEPGIDKSFGFENVETPAPKGQTGDPHRLTMMLPNSDATVLSLGAHGSEASRVVEPGIRGRTNNHVHFEVVGGEGEGGTPPTIVSLGLPMKDTKNASKFAGHALTENCGYKMRTGGTAWHEAEHQHGIASSEGDVLVVTHGKECTAALHSTEGEVSVAAEKDVGIGSKENVFIGADPSAEIDDVKFHSAFEKKTISFLAATGDELAAMLGEIIVNGVGLVAAMAHHHKKPAEGENHWEDESWNYFKIAAEVAETASVIGRMSHAPDGKVEIVGKSYVGMGGLAASMVGRLAATIASAGASTLLGTVANVKGLAYATMISGVQTCIESLKEVEIKAGKALKMQGAHEVELSCPEGDVRIAAERHTQVCADKVVFVSGKEELIMTSGPDAGYAVILTGSERASFGTCPASATKLNGAAVDKKQLLEMVKGEYVSLQMGEKNHIKIMEREAEFLCGKYGVRIHPDATTVDGVMVCML